MAKHLIGVLIFFIILEHLLCLTYTQAQYSPYHADAQEYREYWAHSGFSMYAVEGLQTRSRGSRSSMWNIFHAALKILDSIFRHFKYMFWSFGGVQVYPSVWPCSDIATSSLLYLKVPLIQQCFFCPLVKENV